MMTGSSGTGEALDASVQTYQLNTDEDPKVAKIRASVEHYQRQVAAIDEVLQTQNEKVEKFKSHLDASKEGIRKTKQERNRLTSELEKAKQQLDKELSR